MTDSLFPLGKPAPAGSFTGQAYMHPLAPSDGPMTHIAVTPFNDKGEFVNWGEPVDDSTFKS